MYFWRRCLNFSAVLWRISRSIAEISSRICIFNSSEQCVRVLHTFYFRYLTERSRECSKQRTMEPFDIAPPRDKACREHLSQFNHCNLSSVGCWLEPNVSHIYFLTLFYKFEWKIFQHRKTTFKVTSERSSTLLKGVRSNYLKLGNYTNSKKSSTTLQSPCGTSFFQYFSSTPDCLAISHGAMRWNVAV